MPYAVELGRIASQKLKELPRELRARWSTEVLPLLEHNPRPRMGRWFLITDAWNLLERHVYALRTDSWPGLEIRYYIDPDDSLETPGTDPVAIEGSVYIYDIVWTLD